MPNPFQPYSPPPVRYEIAIAPVHNALISLALLTAELDPAEAEAWVRETSAALSDQQRQRNRLVFEVFGALLPPDRDYPDFPAYLDALAERDPAALRDQALAGLGDQPQLLAGPNALRAKAGAGDPALWDAASALLGDPPALRELIVGHLRAMWQQHLELAWQRRLSQLQGFQLFLQGREFPTTSAGALIRALINREPPEWVAAQLGGVRNLVLVIAPHVRLYATRFGSADTLWLFVLPSPENLALRSAPIKRVELVRPLSALADETRLHILELLAQHGDMPTQTIIAQLGQSQPNVSRHLKQLVAAGFVDELRGEGANKRYRLHPRQADRVFWLLRQLLTPENARQREGDPRAGQPFELRRFLDLSGRVTTWPARREDRALVLGYIAAQFEAGREYTEKEVNAIINQWHAYADHATLRRELFSNKLIDRTKDGARYWRVPPVAA